MNQFKLASTIKPIRSQKTLSITARGTGSSKQKRTHTRGGSVINSKIHKVYSNNMLMGSTKSTLNKTDKKWRPVDEVQQAKNIFITSTNERDYNDEPDKPDMGAEEVKANEAKSPIIEDNNETSSAAAISPGQQKIE